MSVSEKAILLARGVRRGLAAALVLSTVAMVSAADAQPGVPAEPARRVPQTQMGITQLSNDKLDWLLDAKFGMFIHWGLYSGPGGGKWNWGNQGYLPKSSPQSPFREGGRASLMPPIIIRKRGPG